MSPQPLLNKRILLTGATGSLGNETALVLAHMGAKLLLPVRNPAKAEALREKLLHVCAEDSFRFLPLDMSDEVSVNSLVTTLCEENQPMDAIIHNAGVFTTAGQTSSQGHELHQQVNALSPLLLTEGLLPLLGKAKNPVVVTVTSLSAFWKTSGAHDASASPTQLYAASKRMLLESMQQLAKQQPGIRFVYAHPGVCATGLFSGNTNATAYNQHFLKVALPLMRWIFPSPEDACRPTLTALLHGQSGQLAEPDGLFHIWGKPKLVSLSKRF